jgi:membrane-associated phospholipid phosphatase
VFRVLNGTTVLPFVLVWPVMHLGNVVVVPASAALAATLVARVAVAWPWLGRRGRIVAGGPVAAVSPSRVHVGAHLPLDVVGGAGLGVAVAGVLRLLLGRSA